MQVACLHAIGMAATLQIRNVPEDVHRALKTRAAQAGMSLSEYLLAELAAVARRPTIEELTARIAARTAPKVRFDSARAVRAERGPLR
jgi:antitoxin FitA